MQEHGQYELTIKDRVVVVVVIGSWNRETSHRLARELIEIGETLQGAPWAIFFDSREWLLSTADSAELAAQATERLEDLDRTHTAVVLPADLEDMALGYFKSIAAKRAASAPAKFFTVMDDAWAWLHENGF